VVDGRFWVVRAAAHFFNQRGAIAKPNQVIVGTHRFSAFESNSNFSLEQRLQSRRTQAVFHARQKVFNARLRAGLPLAMQFVTHRCDPRAIDMVHRSSLIGMAHGRQNLFQDGPGERKALTHLILMTVKCEVARFSAGIEAFLAEFQHPIQGG
jgi:hypothetical protein